MRLWLAAGLLLFATAAQADVPPLEAPASGNLIFEDQFNRLDLSRYATSYPWGGRWLSHTSKKTGRIVSEEEVYVDPSYTGTGDSPLGLNPFSIIDGKLRIEATIPHPGLAQRLPQKYTSGMLTTYHSFVHQYGYYEMRAKLPAGKGYWPAFWLIPTRISPPGEGPAEIDVFEVLGDQVDILHVTAHWDRGKREQGFSLTVPDVSANFHRYGVLWTDQYIAWYFEGQRMAYITTPDDLKQPLYMIINLAVGGIWPGPPSPQTKFPGALIIDYVRVYDPWAE